jgi:hypothetical protein
MRIAVFAAAALACHAGLSAETSVKEEALAKAGRPVYPACLAEPPANLLKTSRSCRELCRTTTGVLKNQK